MFHLSEEAKIHVYTGHIDMRKSIDGISVLLAEGYKQSPQNGDAFVFTNKQRDKIKLLFWDKNGFVLYYKRMERGRFCYSKYIQDEKILVTGAQLKALLMGLDFYLIGEYKQETYKDFF